MGYWDRDYVCKETDVLAMFTCTPQVSVNPIEAAAAIAGESLTETWTVVWPDLLTACDSYRNNTYKCDPVSRSPGVRFNYMDYDIDLFEERALACLTALIIGNVFWFKAIKALRLGHMRFHVAFLKPFQRPRPGIIVELETLSSEGYKYSCGAFLKCNRIRLILKSYNFKLLESMRAKVFSNGLEISCRAQSYKGA